MEKLQTFKALVSDRTLVLQHHSDRKHSGASSDSGIQPVDLGSVSLLDSKGTGVWEVASGGLGTTYFKQHSWKRSGKFVVISDTVQLEL